jgi:hypothetical protein
LTSTGLTQWQKCLGGTASEIGYSIYQTFDGGYILTGETTSNDNDVVGNHGAFDYWIAKIDGAGILQWQKCLGGTVADAAYCVQQTADAGYVIAGVSWSSDGDVSGNHGYQDYWIVKLYPDFPTDVAKNKFPSSVNISPNPFHETATLTINTTKIEEGTIEIKNILGATAQPPKHFTGNKIKLQRNNLPPGIYFYRITTKDNMSVNGKFIIN